jgi:hypothetical protein
MAFNGAFTIAESATALGSFILTDTSTGSDANLTGRTIYIYKVDGELYTEAISWPIGTTTKTLAILDKDYAFNIKIDWASSSPLADPSTYTYSQIFAFTKFGEYEYGTLTRLQTSIPTVISDTKYYQYKMHLRVELDAAKHAIDFMEDHYAAQRCIDRYQYLITKKRLFY